MTQFSLPAPGRQVYIQAFLDRVRKTSLHSAVRTATSSLSNADLLAELQAHVPSAGRQALQGTGVRDEEVFALPSVLRAAPGVLAYYRLLLGISQKAFYTSATGLRIFRPMEDSQIIPQTTAGLIDDLCDTLNDSLTLLIQSLPVATLKDDIAQLPLLTLGAQADGSWRTQIGEKATKDVFEAMKKIVKNQGHNYVETDVSITVVNNSGREVTLALAPDPDVVIREDFPQSNTEIYKCAIEIKGGSDYSNLHNRVGEAEKSHQKARASGAQDHWTIISLAGADMSRLRQESPSTRQWLDVTEVIAGSGASWTQLTALTATAMGI